MEEQAGARIGAAYPLGGLSRLFWQLNPVGVSRRGTPAILDGITMHPEQLEKIIRPVAMPNYTVDFSWRDLDRLFAMFEAYGYELSPDFQRGHVWTADQQRHYVENAMRDNLSNQARLISFNAPAWSRDVSGDLPETVLCIDGLQRITAVQALMAGRIKPFGLTLKDVEGSEFDPLRRNNHRFSFKVAVFKYQNRSELLDYYIDLNGGGTPHSAEEIQRVKAMRDQLNR